MSGMAEVLAAHWSRSTHSDFEPMVDKCDGCGEVIYTWGDDPAPGGIEPLASHQADMLTAAGFWPVKGEKRLMQLAALMAYDAVEDNVKREAAAKALDDAADAIEPAWFQYHGGRKDMNEGKRAWLRARAAAVRGEG